MPAHSPAASRYARAFFRLAEERGRIAQAQADVVALVDLHDRSPELAAFVANPIIPPARRQAALRDLFAGRLQEDTVSFLGLLAEKRRLAELPAIAAEFLALCRRHAGLVRVLVTSAQPLDADQLERLLAKLRARLGKAVEADTAVDPSLLGGFRVRVGDEVIDTSVATQLQNFRLQVLAPA